MNFIKRCPSCGATLRFPQTSELLLIRCPVCSHSFRFDPKEDLSYSLEDSGSVPIVKEGFWTLLLDLLYAPIDFWKWKREEKKPNRFFWQKTLPLRLGLTILVFVLLFSFLKQCSFSTFSLPVAPHQMQNPPPPTDTNPFPVEEESAPPSFEI